MTTGIALLATLTASVLLVSAIFVRPQWRSLAAGGAIICGVAAFGLWWIVMAQQQ